MPRLHITFIASSPLEALMRQLEAELGSYCDVHLLIARDNDHACELYQQHWRGTDAFIFTGKVFLYSVIGRIPAQERPCFAFDDLTVDIRGILLELLLADRSIDFSRVFVDIAFAGNQYLGLHGLLPPGQWPYDIDGIGEKAPGAAGGDVRRLTEAVLRRHMELHRSGKIDLSITRFGAIIPELDKRGYANRYLGPSREYVVGFLLQVLGSLGESAALGQMAGVLAIGFPADPGQQGRLASQVGLLLAEYAAAEGFDFLLHREKETLLALAQHTELDAMTRGFTDCGFKNRFIPAGSPVALGIGSGKSLFQAKRNALSALELSGASGRNVYYISQEGEVYGPLGQGDRPYQREPSEDLRRLAKALKIDHVNLQKLIAYTRLCHTNAVSAEELAEFLGVTLRSASRLLGKVAAGGGATVYPEHIGSGRGRPKKVYELTFLGQLSGEDAT